jgi:chromosome segregation ATPase
MAVLQEKMAEQASRHEKEHEQLKELLRQSRQGVQKSEMETAAVGNGALIELEAKLHESTGKIETLKTEVRRMRQGCQPGATLPSELAENERLKAELGELQRQMREEVEAREAQAAELQSFQKELSAYGGERQGEEAMEEFHDCQTQEDWTRMESQLTAEQMEKSNLQMEHTAKQMELSQMQMALKEAEKQATLAEKKLAQAQKDLQIRDSALRAERDATNVESTAGLIEYVAGFNMGWFRPTQ